MLVPPYLTNSKRVFMNKILCVLAFVIAIVSAACVVDDTLPRPPNGDYYGSSTYYVEEIEYIQDGYYEYAALCSAYVNFEGWFDGACDALIQSKARYANLQCDYYDAYGFPHYYTARFYYQRGFISEYCDYNKKVSVAQADTEASTAADEVVFNPENQPVIKDGQLHAIVTGRTGKHTVKENLGKNLTAEDFLKEHGVLVRKRDTTKPVEKIVTKDQVETTK